MPRCPRPALRRRLDRNRRAAQGKAPRQSVPPRCSPAGPPRRAGQSPPNVRPTTAAKHISQLFKQHRTGVELNAWRPPKCLEQLIGNAAPRQRGRHNVGIEYNAHRRARRRAKPTSVRDALRMPRRSPRQSRLRSSAAGLQPPGPAQSPTGDRALRSFLIWQRGTRRSPQPRRPVVARGIGSSTARLIRRWRSWCEAPSRLECRHCRPMPSA